MEELFGVTNAEVFGLTITGLALVVSLLTLSNAARLKTGILAVSTLFFGVGMLSLAGGFFLLALPAWANSAFVSLISYLFFIFGFILLGLGSFKIFKMSRIK